MSTALPGPDAPTTRIIEKLDAIISLGPPSCDNCMDADERHDERPDGASTWPDEMVVYVNVNAGTMLNWKFRQRCNAHDDELPTPDAATHRAEVTVVHDKTHHNPAAYRYADLYVEPVA